MYWPVAETYIRVTGKWRYLWRIVDERGRFVEFRLTAKRNTKAAKSFLYQARRNCGLYPPMTIVTDKTPTYPAIIKAMDLYAYTDLPIKHIDHNGSSNRIESDRASLNRSTDPGTGFQTLHTAKATIKAAEAFRPIKRHHLTEPFMNTAAEIRLDDQRLFQIDI